jgi:glycosyltransferase involved in cell wall biosynthesis
MRDLIFVSLEPWDEVWRRNQFVCAELARRFPDRRILFVERPLFLPILGRALLRSRKGTALRAVRSALGNRFRRLPDLAGIRVYTPLKWFPNPLPGARAWNEGRMTRGIQNAAKRAGVRDPLLWLNPHDAGFLIARLGERGVVYDITDDWELAEPDGPARARIADQDRELCRRADLTVVCSQALFDSRQGVARRLLLIPNGVNAKHYARTGKADPRPNGLFAPDGTFVPASTGIRSTQTATTPTNQSTLTGTSPSMETATTPTKGEDVIPTTSTESETPASVKTSTTAMQAATPGIAKADWPRPVFGYTGSLHRERIDLDLVELLAQRFPQGSVVLVGPQHWSDDSLARALRKHPNLHAPGSVPYSAIPEVMARFDVCIVPHLQSQFVESLNPIKLWEFLACGKPIVSTDVAGFRDFPALVRLAKNAPSFLQECQNALQEVNACAEVSTPTNNDGLTPTFDNQTATNGDKSIPRDEIGTPSNHDNSVQPNTDKGRCLSNERQREARNHSWSGRVDELIRAWREADLISDEDASARSDAPDLVVGAVKEAR